ncbi:MAG: hypothetical protein AB1522_05000 [Chloroflexota bacterium]
MIATVTHILPLAHIRRARMLPGKGRILVRVGQEVNAAYVVAEADLPGSHILVDVRRILGLRRAEQAHRLIDRKVGERVEKGDILAQTEGLLPKVIRAPADCTIAAIQRGQILLEKPGEHYELKAGVNGVITEVLAERGVVIEAHGALIQGVWGNNQINGGMLQFAVSQPDEEVNRANLDMSLRGSIVVGGFINRQDTLDAAAELPLRGMIVGSIAASLITAAQKCPVPIMVTEGFGQIPINKAAFRLLKTHEKRDVSINTTWNPEFGERPEVVVTLPSQGQTPMDVVEFTVGQTVRILSAPHIGETGTLTAIRPGRVTLPGGLRVQVAEVRLENSQLISLPLTNLDVLE